MDGPGPSARLRVPTRPTCSPDTRIGSSARRPAGSAVPVAHAVRTASPRTAAPGTASHASGSRPGPNLPEPNVSDKPAYIRALGDDTSRRTSTVVDAGPAGDVPAGGRRHGRPGRERPAADRSTRRHADRVHVGQRYRVRRARVEVQADAVRGIDPSPDGDAVRPAHTTAHEPTRWRPTSISPRRSRHWPVPWLPGRKDVRCFRSWRARRRRFTRRS